ncbi:MAG: ROK family protein [Chromatiales bacterium]|jgi:polyphosphate glucokinase|nr:ROK family protein [Chromatiales bacterium]MDH4031010.1 ROK family protein [Chromatiales bacterium]
MASAFGIDIGGSGIKGAPVDLDEGRLAAERHRIPTPVPSTPRAVGAVVRELLDHFGWDGPAGCTFPAVVKDGVTHTAANVDEAWIDCRADEMLSSISGRDLHLINDADAAGIAEVRYGAARNTRGVVIVLTLGTGIGSAIFLDGRLLPNTEFGHLEIRGKAAERRASDRVRKDAELDWPKWAARVEEYLRTMEDLFWPDLFVIGGGVSKRHDHFLPHIDIRTPVVPASLRNDAGIIGAALRAAGDV